MGFDVLKNNELINIHQNNLIDNILKEFSTETEDNSIETLMGIHEHSVIPYDNEDDMLLKKYHHGIGCSHYLVKLSLPDLKNSVS